MRPFSNPSFASSLTVVALLAILGVSLASAPQPARAADDTCEPASRSMVQRRIVAKADEGRDALIRFVNVSKPVHQLDLGETVAWLDAERDRKAACMTALAAIRQPR